MSMLKEAFAAGKFGVTAEMAPPKGYDFSEQLEAAKLLNGKVHGVNVTDMQSASLKASSLGLCVALKNAGVEPILQMTGRDRNRMAIMGDILSAAAFGIDTMLALTGDHPVVGDCPESKRPNWVTCAWPGDYSEILEWQWNEVLIPYWKEAAAIAQSYGVKKIAFEMHPGFCVYNPESLLRLREAVGDIIGANFDPSHLIWQGIDPVAAIRALKGAIYHFHAKDTKIDPYNAAVNGVLDPKTFNDISVRSWAFRTVGYGNDMNYWKDMISNLKMTGYDGVISIEHEDGLMSVKEGLEKAVSFLKEILITEDPTAAWWA